MLKKGLLFPVIFAILAVSAAVALERNLGAFNTVTLTTINASTCSVGIANMLFFATGGEGRLGT